MYAKYIIGALAVVFLVLGFGRLSTNKIQARVWIQVGVIFAIVSLFLQFKGI